MLASRNGGGLYIIDLEDSEELGLNDDNISDVIRSIPERAVLLLKNIDIFVKERGNVKSSEETHAVSDLPLSNGVTLTDGPCLISGRTIQRRPQGSF